jgi:hypothetical protein
MSSYGVSYQVARPTGVCAATGAALRPGDWCIASLCEREGGAGFERKDYSLAAWEGGDRPVGLFSHWRTRVPESTDSRRLLVDDEVLVNLFERLAADARPQRTAFRFVLTLILMRKRLLKYVGRDNEGGQERWLMQRRGTAEQQPEPVVNPHLADDDIRTLTDQLSEILHAEI